MGFLHYGYEVDAKTGLRTMEANVMSDRLPLLDESEDQDVPTKQCGVATTGSHGFHRRYSGHSIDYLYSATNLTRLTYVKVRRLNLFGWGRKCD